MSVDRPTERRLDELMEIAIRAVAYPDPTASDEAADAFLDFNQEFTPQKCVELTDELLHLRLKLQEMSK